MMVKRCLFPQANMYSDTVTYDLYITGECSAICPERGSTLGIETFHHDDSHEVEE